MDKAYHVPGCCRDGTFPLPASRIESKEVTPTIALRDLIAWGDLGLIMALVNGFRLKEICP
ncbi:hypothetical protein N8E89_27200 (plasmid) [Phyllobacterium sp. A18/5-2]|uniref:hypothetical protein n=1 Tax=Phyllobacterium sp. A18/5-2 TaxID=2978392 RepID=UPI0021C5FA3D|nr:hypothetical protein [Phyllobacterium sp. A18/5-2]UXN67626.1 hypothetical protein N8E89_27200 [Phyllobacterium sp. A18/5-2]